MIPGNLGTALGALVMENINLSIVAVHVNLQALASTLIEVLLILR